VKGLAVACLLLLLASGCVGVKDDSGTTTSGGDPCAQYQDDGRVQDACEQALANAQNGTVSGPLPPPPGKYEKVDIHEQGDLSAGVDKAWSWTTEPNATVFDVKVVFNGAGGAAPNYLITDYSYTLDGGPTGKTHLGMDGGSGSTAFSTAGCVLCYEGRGKTDNFGTWHLNVHVGNGAGTWDVTVKTAYNNAPPSNSTAA
jgi:hypothetical protein